MSLIKRGLDKRPHRSSPPHLFLASGRSTSELDVRRHRRGEPNPVTAVARGGSRRLSDHRGWTAASGPAGLVLPTLNRRWVFSTADVQRIRLAGGPASSAQAASNRERIDYSITSSARGDPSVAHQFRFHHSGCVPLWVRIHGSFSFLGLCSLQFQFSSSTCGSRSGSVSKPRTSSKTGPSSSYFSSEYSSGRRRRRVPAGRRIGNHFRANVLQQPVEFG